MDIFSEIAVASSISFFLGWTLRPRLSGFLLRQKNNSLLGKTKLAMVVATNLKMSKGKIASQCSHAAVACYKQGLLVSPNIINEWERTGTPKVILAAQSETHLKEIAQKAEKAGLITVLIRDAGRTQVSPGSVTVLGIGPAYDSRINVVTSELKLL